MCVIMHLLFKKIKTAEYVFAAIFFSKTRTCTYTTQEPNITTAAHGAAIIKKKKKKNEGNDVSVKVFFFSEFFLLFCVSNTNKERMTKKTRQTPGENKIKVNFFGGFEGGEREREREQG